MPPPREWATGYLEQALADMKGAARLQGVEPSVLAMLLQMVLEKLGKAALLRSGSMQVQHAQRTHAAALAMVQLMARDRRACRRVGWRPEVLQRHVAPIVQELERAQPALAPNNTPCLEYPWEDPNGTVQWPSRHLPLLRWFRVREGGAGLLLFRFTDDLCAKFDTVFP